MSMDDEGCWNSLKAVGCVWYKGESENFEWYEWAWMTKDTEIHKKHLDMYDVGVIGNLGWEYFAHLP